MQASHFFRSLAVVALVGGCGLCSAAHRPGPSLRLRSVQELPGGTLCRLQVGESAENLDMSLFHAVAFVEHPSAQVLQFDAVQVVESQVHERLHFTPQHHIGVRSGHEFFGKVCDALDGIAEVLVTGGHTGLTDFRRYVDTHRPLTAACIVGYEVVDNPTENQLVSLARKRFVTHDETIGTRSDNPV
jgi:hypothetical protein